MGDIIVAMSTPSNLSPLIAAVQSRITDIQPTLATLTTDANNEAAAIAAANAATAQLNSDASILPAQASALAAAVDALNAAVNPAPVAS